MKNTRHKVYTSSTPTESLPYACINIGDGAIKPDHCVLAVLGGGGGSSVCVLAVLGGGGSHRAAEVCRQDLPPLDVLLEAEASLLQRGLVACLAQLPQDQAPQQGLQMACRTTIRWLPRRQTVRRLPLDGFKGSIRMKLVIDR